jgi:trimethylamine--corrinoid protein Co-methyltransferase
MIKLNQRFSRSPYLEILTEEQVYAIHSTSLGILERTGMQCANEAALKIFRQGGACVDGNSVRIPPIMIEQALQTAPSRILITGRHGKGEVLLERNVVNYGLGTDLMYHIDPYTGKTRQTILKDVENIAKVVHKCKYIDFNSDSGFPSDIQPEMHDLYQYKTGIAYCDKPFFIAVDNGENMRALIEMDTVFAGSSGDPNRTPSLIVYREPVSPLMFHETAVEVLMVCAEYKVPIVFTPILQTGATGPMTLAGSIAQGNAETLASLVLHQLRAPGAPFIWGPGVSMMDMHTTLFCYGGPIIMKAQAALGQIGRFYNLPIFGFTGITDSATIDVQCGIEMMWSVLINALAGLNLCHDVGYMNSGLLGSLEAILLGNEIISAVSSFMDGIQINEETLALEVINKVGSDGNFLREEHTRKFLKQESWYPQFLNRRHFKPWHSDAGKTVNQELQDKAQQIIEEDAPPLISEVEAKELDKIITAREKQLDIK